MRKPVRLLFIILLLTLSTTPLAYSQYETGGTESEKTATEADDELKTEAEVEEAKPKIPVYKKPITQRRSKNLKKGDPVGLLVVMTDFEKAEVKVDDEVYEEDLSDGLQIKAKEKHKVVVEWDGGSKKTYEIKLRKGEARVIMVDLTNKKSKGYGAKPTAPKAKKNNKKEGIGYVSVSSKPSGQVYVDGKMVSEETPMVKYEINTGQHSIRVFFPELERYSDTKKAVVHKGNHINLYFTDRKARRNTKNPNKPIY